MNPRITKITKITKNFISLFLAFFSFSLFSINNCYAVKVGDLHEGGTVFCVSQTSDTTKCVTDKGATGDYGLIMANEDQVNYDSNSKHGVTWSSEYKEIGPSAQSLDDGKANTDAIIKAHPKDNPSNNAAWLCHAYKDKEGHTDWYLPAKNELNKMYIFAKANNLIGKGCSGSKTGGVQCLIGGGSYTGDSKWNKDNEYKIYWSSSEYSDNAHYYAWAQDFSNGLQFNGYYLIHNYFAARAIRAFNPSTIQQFNKLFMDLNLNQPKAPQKIEKDKKIENAENEEKKEDKKIEEDKFVKKIEDEEKAIIKDKSAKSLSISETVPLIPWDEVVLISELGRGGFGIVYKGTWKHGGDVAIKQIIDVLEEDAEKELKSEANIMAKLNSPYIVRLFGLSWDEDKKKYAMVMELMPNASLFQLLRSGKELPWNIRYSIARDVAYGLRFLHDRKILHRDLKSANVLLDEKLRAKLSDFGLSKVKTQTAIISSASRGLGTVAWMAPELFDLEPKYSPTSDVYAYGMTAWELASCEKPYKNVIGFNRENIIMDAVGKGKRDKIPTDCPKEFAELIEKCWSQKPSERPSMDMVVKGLESLLPKK